MSDPYGSSPRDLLVEAYWKCDKMENESEIKGKRNTAGSSDSSGVWRRPSIRTPAKPRAAGITDPSSSPS